MQAASRLADCLLNDLSQFDKPLSSECAELAHFAATYLWYGCCGGGNPASQDAVGSDLSLKDCVLFTSCCQYLELLLLGHKELSAVPKQLTAILKSFKKPPTVARCKVVIAGIQHILQLIVCCIEAESDDRLTLACILTESVAVFVSFLVSFKKCEAAKSAVRDFLSSLDSNTMSDFIAQSDLAGLKLVGRMLSAFVKSIGSTKLSKRADSFSVDVAQKCFSLLNSSLREFKPGFSKLQPATARAVVLAVESLVGLLLEKKGDDVLSAEGLQTAVSVYTYQLELCGAMLLQRHQIPGENDAICQIVCLKMDVWFRKLQLINDHLQKDSSFITGVYTFSRDVVN